MLVLGIETSCDETGVGIVGDDFKVYANVRVTHLEHSDFGGVVPEIASRAHLRLIYPLTLKALEISKMDFNKDIDAVAVTYGPGLIGALLVGVSFAKALAQAGDKKIIAINHLEGHIFSLWLTYPDLKPPILILLVSGGHTQLIYMEDFFKYKLIGQTLDDAAGEAFDKGGRILGLPYPAGPLIDKYSKKGDRGKFHFPRAKVEDYDFSFSGLKTALLYFVKEKGQNFVKENLFDICASYQEAIIDMLFEKVKKAYEDLGVERIGVVGGVSLNSRLREVFLNHFKNVYFPDKQFCIDNGAMIAGAGLFRLKNGFQSDFSFGVEPYLSIF